MSTLNIDLKKTPPKEMGTMYQVSIMNALLEGIYEGPTSLATLSQYGDFGLGTFNQLDGELIGINGEFYQIRNDGTSERAHLDQQVPFAAVTTFHPEITYELKEPMNKKGLDALMKNLILSENLFYAIYAEGFFSQVRTRTVSLQQKPYRPFTEVVKEQTEFDFENREGMLVGFFSPSYVQGVSISGYHLHFLSQNRKGGGHVIDFILESGKVYVQTLPNYKVILPKQMDFELANLSGDTSAAIKETEG